MSVDPPLLTISAQSAPFWIGFICPVEYLGLVNIPGKGQGVDDLVRIMEKSGTDI